MGYRFIIFSKIGPEVQATLSWLLKVLSHIKRYVSYIVTEQISFQIQKCCRAPNRMQLGF